ncbi:MAG TPA: glycoside hydrolase family 2 TIM barrel-domain containing protein [Ferruginibacter sp.]|nr:glycoside hydrolase family 2 TIM barrel-domain containing protein [Ferruginibacter sp.]
MKKILGLIILVFAAFIFVSGQVHKQNINKGWKFYYTQKNKWFPATVPGTIHTDLLKNKLIVDPYYRDNEKKLQWIDKENWDYKTSFTVTNKVLNQKNIELVFDGLDTYADVYLNGKKLLSADNMFRQWRVDVKNTIKSQNELHIRFYSAKNITDSIAKSKLPFVVPDNPRVYARKAQYHFGWDWGPTYITCGIWKNIFIEAYNEPQKEKPFVNPRKVELIQEPDSIGRTFYFKIDGKPVYMKGANYIPSEMFLPRLKKEDYRKIILAAKDANMNMLRIWGGGIYEDDAFYDLCDEYGIMVWQDFMFAGGMVPGDEHFFNNVKEEVKYQIKRLRHHPCIVIWCGNNEVDEAWNNWGWQNQFNLHGEDSVKMWNDYKRLFRDSIAAWVKEYDGTRPYTSTSPLNGWGRANSITEGDSHYWGVWWGLQDIEMFENKTGRFVSEYGMQAMPNYNTTLSVTQPGDRFLFSDVLKAHQKHPTGYQNIQSYLHRYFLDSSAVKKLSLENYTYLTQCFQYYTLKNIIAIHRSKYPVNMGTLLWQLNDCWPVCSWSITDYSRQPKAAWYAVKEAYRDDVLPQRDSIRPINLKLQKPEFNLKYIGEGNYIIESNVDAKYVYLYLEKGFLNINDNYFDLKAGEKKKIYLKDRYFSSNEIPVIKIKSLYDIR